MLDTLVYSLLIQLAFKLFDCVSPSGRPEGC